MINSKLKIIGITLMSTLIIALGAFKISNKIGTVQYNTNPDISSKVVGSETFVGYRMRLTSMEELLRFADLVIIGEILTDGETKEKPISASPEQDAKFTELFSKVPTYKVAQTNVKVNKVIYGDSNLVDTIIKFNQLGEAGNDYNQTKAKKGDEMLLILCKSDEDDTYASVSFEDGMFLIDKNNGKLLSLSKDILVAKYDGLDQQILENDIKKSIKKAKRN